MKIKNSNENLTLKSLFPAMYIASLVLVVLRTLQLTKYIDSQTGFFTGGAALKILVYALIAVVCLGFIVVSFLSQEGKRVELAGYKDKSAGIASAVFGAGLLFDWISSILKSFSIFGGNSFYAENNAELFKLLMSSGALPYALQSVFALISAIYIFIFARSLTHGTFAAHKHKYIALAPVGWATFKLITRFVKQISYIKVSDLFLELIMLAFMILFFVALSQVASGVYSDDTRWRITALGLSSALVCITVNVPRLVLTVFAGEFVNKEYPFSLADTAFAFFAIFVALAAYKSTENNNASE